MCFNEEYQGVGMLTYCHQGRLQFVNKKEKSEDKLDVFLENVKGKYDYT